MVVGPELLVDAAHAVDGDVLHQQLAVDEGIGLRLDGSGLGCRPVGVGLGAGAGVDVDVGGGCGCHWDSFHWASGGRSSRRPVPTGVVVPIYSTRCHNGGVTPQPPVGGPALGTEPARGRRPSTSREALARAALDLFAARGYDDTTVDDIAGAVGVSRRTFFRYFDSKRDVVWGEFDAELARLDAELRGAPADEPMMDVLRRAVVATNRFGAGELGELRIRISLISTVPSLIAHSAVRYAEWCDVVAAFAARRTGGAPEDLGPQTLARSALGAATAAFTYWARGGADDLAGQVDRAFRLLAAGFGAPKAAR